MTWTERILSAQEAAQKIQSGNRIFITGNCSTPLEFTKALLARHQELQDVEVLKLLDIGAEEFFGTDLVPHIHVNNLFIGTSQREAVNAGLADFTPMFLSDIPRLFQSGRCPLDVAIIHVSPPDAHGYCSFGVEVSVSKTAAETASIVIAEVNPQMPRTLGDSFIHVDKIDYFIQVDYELPAIGLAPVTDIQAQIAQHITPLIPDGATLQTGIGGIPDAVLRRLSDHRNLGIHTELFSDGVMEMIEKGVITNALKSIHPGKVVAGFVLGSHKLFHYIHDNPLFEFHPTAYVNDPFVIAQNARMVSINSAIEIDLTGQVCADSIGTSFYSGVGGQLDFVRGAAKSEGGMSFIALPSTAKGGKVSRIVPSLKIGAGVTTSRNDVRMVATEYGVVDLWGMSIRERVHALVSIAHPDFREDLLRFAHEQHYIGANSLVKSW